MKKDNMAIKEKTSSMESRGYGEQQQVKTLVAAVAEVDDEDLIT